MNILFYHGDETCPTMGGIQRTTAVVACGLAREYGHHCYNIYDYEEPYPVDVPRYKYIDSRRLKSGFSADELAPLLKEWKIDVVVNQAGQWNNHIFKEAIQKAGRECKLLYFHHNTPRRLVDTTIRRSLRLVTSPESSSDILRGILRIVSHPIYKYYSDKRVNSDKAESFRRVYEDADRFVLLSPNYYQEWSEISGITDFSRLRAIPNALSFHIRADEEMIQRKEKRVLIVARMIEFHKRILLGLKIWREIMLDSAYSDWQLDIVGAGQDLDVYKAYVRRHKVPNVKFYGRSESLPFYEKASIFLMLSAFEGWPMTLNEAHQLGVVPVAFDSFGAARDIIIDGENGFLVRPFDKEEYMARVKLLMRDDNLRRSMAHKGVESSDRFTLDKVLAKWEFLLSEK
ncbi:MAG: glycosyltransferase [Muribaculaceae bacterium]|nr:glycosyltransferase [Muribaculaceae bacterium]